MFTKKSCIIVKVDHKFITVLPNKPKKETPNGMINCTHLIKRARRCLAFFQAEFCEQNLLWVHEGPSICDVTNSTLASQQ